MAKFRKITEFKYAVFDLDGTLIDSIEHCKKVFAALAGVRGIPEEEARQFYVRTTGMPLEEQFKMLLLAKGVPYTEQEITALKAGFNTEFIKYKIKFFPGAKRLVQELGSREITVMISSASSDFTVEKRLRDGKLISYVSLFHGSTAIPKGQAHIDSFAKQLNIRAADFAANGFFCGDGETDMKIAVNAGFYPIGIAGTVSAELLEASDAQRVVKNIADLLEDLHQT